MLALQAALMFALESSGNSPPHKGSGTFCYDVRVRPKSARTLRPKYAACRCGQLGMTITPLPPRLLPQSQLAVGLAVCILLARYDDHLPFYRWRRLLASAMEAGSAFTGRAVGRTDGLASKRALRTYVARDDGGRLCTAG
jgi:transposase